MKKCTRCDINYPNDKSFCRECGSRLFEYDELETKSSVGCSVFEDKLTLDPLNRNLLVEYATFLIENQIYDKAVGVNLKILALEKENLNAKKALLKAYASLDKHKDAIVIGEQVVDDCSEDESILFIVAESYFSLENYNKTIEICKRIIHLQPLHLNALEMLATAYLLNNNIEDAIATFIDLKKSGFNNPLSIIYAGIGDYLKGDISNAITQLKIGIQQLDDLKSQDNSNYDRGMLVLAAAYSKSPGTILLAESTLSTIDINSLSIPFDEKIYVSCIKIIIDYYLSKDDITERLLKSKITGYLNYDIFFNTQNDISELQYRISKRLSSLKYHTSALIYAEKAVVLNPENIEFVEYLQNLRIETAKFSAKRKRKYIILIGLGLFLCISIPLAIFLILSNQEKKAWNQALQTNTDMSYASFMVDYPKSKFFKTAESKIRQIKWDATSAQNTIDAYMSFLELYPEGDFSDKARIKADDILWHEAVDSLNYDKLYEYINVNNGIHIEQARQLFYSHFTEIKYSDYKQQLSLHDTLYFYLRNPGDATHTLLFPSYSRIVYNISSPIEFSYKVVFGNGKEVQSNESIHYLPSIDFKLVALKPNTQIKFAITGTRL